MPLSFPLILFIFSVSLIDRENNFTLAGKSLKLTDRTTEEQ